MATDREPRSHRPVASPPGRPVVRRRNGPRSARRRLTLPRSAEGSTIAVAGRASGIQGVSGSRLSQIPRAQAFRTIGGYTDTLIAPTAGGPAGHVPSRKRAQERPSGVRPPVRHFRASGACTLAANGRVDAEVSIGAAALLDSRSCGSLGRCDRARRHCRSRLQSSSRRSTARQRWRLPLPLGEQPRRRGSTALLVWTTSGSTDACSSTSKADCPKSSTPEATVGPSPVPAFSSEQQQRGR